MKTLITVLVSMMLAVSFSISAGPHDHEMEDGQKDQMMGMMGNPDTRSMMMDQIAQSPEMRHDMMQKMMQSMGMDTEMDMHKMMTDPEMQAHMQKHMKFMQTMLNSEGMSQEDMQAMMNNPEMETMMKMHMMCSKMMDSEMMGMHSTDEAEKHSGEGHIH